MEGQFNNKQIKPSLSTPTPAGKQLDSNFNKQIRTSGMNIKEEKPQPESKYSFKKQIFDLDKTETLVHTDEFLSTKFSELKGGEDEEPSTIWGYHWNEVLLNIIFNNYILNSPKYLQKYKNTKAKEKTRRGEEGIKQLQNDLQKDKEVSSNAEKRRQDIMTSNEPKEKVDELFGFGNSNNANTPLPTEKRSKNDTYFVDVNAKRLLAVVPYSMTPEEKQKIITQYVGKPNIKQLSWYAAVKQGIKGVPTQVADGSIDAMDKEFAAKYGQGYKDMIALAEEPMFNHAQSTKSKLPLSAFAIATNIASQLPDAATQADVQNAVEAYFSGKGYDVQKLSDQELWSDIIHFLQSDFNKTITETTTAASSGQFSKPLENVDNTYVSETTTSASSGAYSGKAIWAKNPANSRFAHNPAWKGGKIVSESIVKGDKNYMTDPSAFKKYIIENRVIEIINECYGNAPENPEIVSMGEGETFQQHSQKMLAKLQKYAQEMPELNNDPDFAEILKIAQDRANGKETENQNNPSATKPTIPVVSEGDYEEAMVKDLKYSGHPVRDNESTDELESKDGLFKGKWDTNEGYEIVNDKNLDAIKDNFQPTALDEKAESKAQQRFMGMVHAAQKGELKNPSSKVEKAAEKMTDKAAKDYAATKHKGLPEKVKKMDEGIFSKPAQSTELNIDQLRTMIDNFIQMPSQESKIQFIKAKDFIKSKAGNIVRMPQLKMWLDQNMPQLSTYVGALWGNWDLMLNPSNQLSENSNKMKINIKEYKELVKTQLKESKMSLSSMSEQQKKDFFTKVDSSYKKMLKESMIDDQPDSMINNQETSMVNSMDSDELNTSGADMSSSSEPIQQEGYDNDDMGVKKSVADKYADYSDDEPEQNDGETTSEPVVAKAPEKDASYYHSGADDAQVAQDANKFKEMLMSKYGVSSASELSPLQRQELMKSMTAPTAEKPTNDMDFTKYMATDNDKAAFQARDQKRLDFLAQNANKVTSINDYNALASQFKQANGENMHHPMAVLASIQQLPKDSLLRSKLSNIENVLSKQVGAQKAEPVAAINEDRKTSSILNVEKLGAENAKNFKKDLAKEDGVEQNKTYPKDDGIHKAPVWPEPKDFYIEQDLDKVQKEAKTMADLEKEALAKSNGSLDNQGNSTADGKHIPKRNLTKEEGYELAMNRGQGMHNIVYDNKPSEKFEERMEKDMGKEVYKNRQDKMKYQADAPTYNKDTQPTEGGDKKEQDNKFAKGYNNESITGKYYDEFGKFKIFEFMLHNVEELKTISESAIKLSVDGLGNKYSLNSKKMNENKAVNDIMSKYDFYLLENKVVAIEKNKLIVETKIEVKKGVNESLNKMKHLMNYKPSNYVDTKNSVKF